MRKAILPFMLALPLAVSAQGPPSILWSSNRSASAVAISRDDALLAAWTGTSNPQITIWNSTNGAVVRNITSPAPMSRLLAFSPTGNLLASAGPELTETNKLVFLRLWSVADGTLVREMAHQDGQFDWVTEMTGLVFSPDGQFLAVSDCCPDGHVTLWRVSDGTFVREFGFNSSGGLASLALS